MNPERQKQLIYIALCISLNVGLGKISNLLALPFTMDTIGTILSAALLPWPFVLAVGAFSSLLAFIIIHPAFIFFIGTQIAIGIAAVLLMKVRMFDNLYKAAVSGLIIGIVSAVVSSPVIVVMFGGVSIPSISALNALFLASGKSLWTSVISGSMIVESIDKIVAGVVAWLAISRLPGLEK